MGLNFDPIASPSESKKPPRVKIAPEATRTPGVRCTRGSSEAEIVGVSPLSCLTRFLELTTTATPLFDSLKISSKAARIVSVRT